MARHAIELANLKDKITNIKSDGKTLEEGLFGEGVDDLQIFKNQQQIMEFAVHSADLSQACRSFNEVVEWTFLLFEEFF